MRTKVYLNIWQKEGEKYFVNRNDLQAVIDEHNIPKVEQQRRMGKHFGIIAKALSGERLDAKSVTRVEYGILGPKKDTIIRISRENYARLKATAMALIEHAWEGKDVGIKPTTNQLLEKMLDSVEVCTSGDIKYLAGGKVFDNVKDARGEAVIDSVRVKGQILWPVRVVEIGVDDGG